MSANVILSINGQNFTGWTRVAITRSIEQVAGTFTLTLTERWADSDNAPPQIRAGDACQVLCDDQLVITGYVDDALPSYDVNEHTISISGRSKAADLVDCGLPGQQFKEQTLTQLATILAAPYGIAVQAETDVGEPFARPTVEPGQTGFEFLEKLARQRGVRLMSAADGTLLIIRAGTELLPTALELGINILKASGRFSHRDRFSEQLVVGQTIGTDTWSGDAAAVNQGGATDSEIRAARRHVVVSANATDAAACTDRATWQRNTAYGRGQALTYTVNGWGVDGELWQPNKMVTVRDRWMRLDGERLLIPSLQYLFDKEGQRTELQVMPPEAFDLIPLPAKPAADTAKAWS